MYNLIFFKYFLVEQSTPAILCIPSQCLQGFSNTTRMYCLLLFLFAIVESIFCLLDLVGAKLTAYGATTIHLLHGKYSGSSSPQVLHDSLTSPSAFLSSSSVYANSTALSLPLNLALQPGWLSSQVLFILDSHHL